MVSVTPIQKKGKGAICLYPKKQKLGYLEEKPEVYKLQVMRCPVIDRKGIIAYAAKAAHVPESTVALAQEALFDAINYFCVNGHSVQVAGLGSFGIKLNSKVAKTVDEANADTITRKYIRFFPKAEIREMCSLKNINLHINDILNLKEENSGNGGTPTEP